MPLWTPLCAPDKTWQWTTGALANGWAATVIDCGDGYRALAVCRWWSVFITAPFRAFVDAKYAALQMTLAQGPASNDRDKIVRGFDFGSQRAESNFKQPSGASRG